MKVKRVKQAKRIIAFYHQNFGLRQPYQIIIDGSFAHAALKMKINIKEQLPKYLGGEVQCLTSRCASLELQALGSAGYGAMQILKTYDERHCGHTVAKAKPTPDCVTSLIGEDNRHHYIVATQDPDLRKRLRHLPGVPILLVTHNTIMLEKPSDASMEKADKIVESKLAGSAAERETVRKLRPDGDGTAKPDAPRRRKRKGANPLSCLKKKPKIPSSDVSHAVTGTAPPKKRKRLRPGRQKALAESGAAVMVAESH